jgi:transposase-like protein
VIEEMQDWVARPLDEVYAAVFIDAIMVKVRDGQVANRPIYARSASPWTARRTCWAVGRAPAVRAPSSGWRADRPAQPRVKDVFFLVCDGLKGLPEVVANVWPSRSCRRASST